MRRLAAKYVLLGVLFGLRVVPLQMGMTQASEFVAERIGHVALFGVVHFALVWGPVGIVSGAMAGMIVFLVRRLRLAKKNVATVHSATEIDQWERCGTNVDKHGQPLTVREPRPVPHLTSDERALYLDLVHPSWARKGRVEQERIPLPMDRASVVAASGD